MAQISFEHLHFFPKMFASYGALAPVLREYEFKGSQADSHVSPGKYKSLKTMDDGACAVHAVLGDINNDACVKYRDPREWVRSILKHFETVEDCKTTLKDHVEEFEAEEMMQRALSVIEHELLEELLKFNPSKEAECLRDCIFHNNEESILEELRQTRENYEKSCIDLDQKKLELKMQLRSLFTHPSSKMIMKSIAEKEDLLRPDGTGEFDSESFYYSQDVMMVKCTQKPWPEDTPVLSKYEVLFEPAPVFDGLRRSFVDSIKNKHGNHVKFQDYLNDALGTMVDVGSLVHVLQPVYETLDELNKFVLPSPIPDNSGRRLWKCYVEAQYKEEYWFSVDELKLLCVLGGRSETFSLYRIEFSGCMDDWASMFGHTPPSQKRVEGYQYSTWHNPYTKSKYPGNK